MELNWYHISQPASRQWVVNVSPNESLGLCFVFGRRIAVAILCASFCFSCLGCRTPQHRAKAAPSRSKAPERTGLFSRGSSDTRVQNVICLFDQRPWISVDAAGDRDPEGLQYRVFLNDGGDKGVAREGTLHIEMYRFGRDEKGVPTRNLVSDWHYPTSQFPQVSAALMGLGYHVQLHWAKKDLAGNEVEIVTQFEDPKGNITRGATKRLRVPKYSS
jgi:hypothetical protein